MPTTPSRPRVDAGTVYFLSDFGTVDEFVGVVHAVIGAQAPGTVVVDLTHHVPAFDVRAGSRALVRAVPHLGPGVVLGVVDPGVGTDRRGIAIEVARPTGGSLCFVGPDNGLLVAAAEVAGPLTEVVELRRGAAPHDRGATFDGRDLFAPAAAALGAGMPLARLGRPVPPASLVRLPDPVIEPGRLDDGRACLRTEVTWVDRFGNIQLAATATDGRAAGLPTSGLVELAARTEMGGGGLEAVAPSLRADGVPLRRVAAFGDVGRAELGLLVDANGHLAVVAGEASAADWLDVAAGELLVLAW